MSMKYYGIFMKLAGFSVFLVPLFLKSISYIKSIPELWLIVLIVTGATLILTGSILEAKGIKLEREEQETSF